MRFVLVLVLAVLAATSALASGADVASDHGRADAQSGYYARPGREGWFWYQDPPVPDNATERKTAKAPPSKPDFDGFRDVDFQAVWTMHPDAFQDLVTKTQKWAVQNPTPERLRHYAALQMVAAERSKRFSEAWTDVIREHPALDASVRRSPTSVGSYLEVAKVSEDKSKAIETMRERMGLLLFVQQGCPYCVKGEEILRHFVATWGWSNVRLVDIRRSPHIAQEYGVEITPDLWVVGKGPDGQIRQGRLKAGLAELSDIETGLLRAWSLWFEGKRYDPTMSSSAPGAFESLLKKIGTTRLDTK